MNKGTSVLLAVALVSGGAAAYFMNEYITNTVDARRAELDIQYEPVEAVVAAYNIRVGEMLSFENLVVRKVPSGFLHTDAITPDYVENIIGRRLLYPIQRGEVLLQSHAATKTGTSFSAMIPEGERALTFPVDQVSSVNGLLRPGDRIDLLVTMDNGSKTFTIALLTDVTILATGEAMNELDASERNEHYQTITLSVSSENAAKITHAREAGTMSVILRAPEDPSPAFPERVDDAYLMGQTKKKVRRGVEIIRGGRN
ncbi:MAG: Flp pilus assembly protein CpaB [Gammaproteobacteria bacterium]